MSVSAVAAFSCSSEELKIISPEENIQKHKNKVKRRDPLCRTQYFRRALHHIHYSLGKMTIDAAQQDKLDLTTDQYRSKQLLSYQQQSYHHLKQHLNEVKCILSVYAL